MHKIKGATLPVLFLLVLFFLFRGSLLQAQSASDGENVNIPEAPNPPKLFNDYVGILSETEALDLEMLLMRMNDSTTVQIAVVIVPTVGQYDIADYAQQLAMKWGIGLDIKNNGVLLVLAMNDHKSRIHVGYGLEGVLTDIQTSQILDQVLMPSMRQKAYESAITKTISAIYQAAKGEYKAVDPGIEDSKKEGGFLRKIWKYIWHNFDVFIIFYGFIIVWGILEAIFRKITGRPIKNVSRNSSSFWSLGSFRSSRRSSSGRRSFGGFGGGSFGGGGSSGSW